MSSAADQAQLYLQLHTQLVYVYCTVSSGAILIYDQLVTLSDEVEHVWKRKWTGATLLFFLNRYATLLKTIVGFSINWATCKVGELWYNIFDIIALFVFAAFSAFRVWAIWGKDLRPFLIVLPFSLITPCLNTYRVSAEVVTGEINPLPPPFGGCEIEPGMPLSLYIRCKHVFQHLRHFVVSRSSRTLGLGLFGSVADIVRGFAIATDALVLLMTWLRTRGIYRAAIRINVKPSLSAMLLRDGTIYFGVLLVFNIVDLILNHTEPNANPVNYFSDVVNCIMISRFMLNLRSIHSTPHHEADATYTAGHPDFIQSNVLGDLAATVDLPFHASTDALSTSTESGSSRTETREEDDSPSQWPPQQTPTPEWHARDYFTSDVESATTKVPSSGDGSTPGTLHASVSRSLMLEDVHSIHLVSR